MRNQLLDFIGNLKLSKNIQSFDEAKIKQAVILRCLSILGWNTYDIEEVCPEYSVGSESVQKRVDYSLRINNINEVFLMVKKPTEELEKYQEQLSGYFFYKEVKFAVLTNGIVWWFYLPLKEGSWKQRKFCSIDISQQAEGDITDKFRDFLAREKIASGEAFEKAENIYIDKELYAKLIKAWNSIITKPDDLLIDLIIETAGSIGGYRIDSAAIKQFLINHRDQFVLTLDKPSPPKPEDYKGKKISAFYFKERKYKVSFWKDLLIEFCNIMNTLHGDDFDKVLELRGRSKPYFTCDKSQLNQPALIPNTHIFVETCQNANQIVKFCYRIIRLFGYSDKDLRIEVEPD